MGCPRCDAILERVKREIPIALSDDEFNRIRDAVYGGQFDSMSEDQAVAMIISETTRRLKGPRDIGMSSEISGSGPLDILIQQLAGRMDE